MLPLHLGYHPISCCSGVQSCYLQRVGQVCKGVHLVVPEWHLQGQQLENVYTTRIQEALM